VSLGGRCGNCGREILLDQLVQPGEGFRCPFCGFAFAPGYASVAPGVAAQAMVAHAALVRSLAELRAMTAERLRLDPDAFLDPIRDALGTQNQPA
jgi:hypothetical protein